VIKDRFPKLPVILISGHGDIRIAVRAIKIGAWDFVEKPFNNKVILKTVRGAITESADGRHPARAAQKFKNAIMTLTPREKEVYDLVITGKTTPEIANILFISTRTVSAHRASIKAKTNTRGVADLIRLSIQISK
jgi:FixJ family two-component response regulator